MISLELFHILYVPYNILNLPAIDVSLSETLISSFVYVHFVLRAEEIFPDSFTRVDTQIIIFERHMDTRLESVIECGHTIARQEQYSFVVFQDAQENRNQGVAFQIMERATFKEDVSLVDKQDGLPGRSHVKDATEPIIKRLTICPKVAGGYHVEWPLAEFCHCLRRERLSDSWRAMQNHDETLAFAFHDVIKAQILLHMCSDKSTN